MNFMDFQKLLMNFVNLKILVAFQRDKSKSILQINLIKIYKKI